ncbi:MAG TPA: hypothetical protein VIC62_20390 [Nakamurella sp.]
MSAPGGSDGPTIGAGVLPEASPAVAITDAPASPPRRRARIVVAGVLALLFLGLAALCVRRGIVTDTWPAFLPATDSTSITRYQGPWLSAAAVALLGAGLSIMALIRGIQGRGGPR